MPAGALAQAVQMLRGAIGVGLCRERIGTDPVGVRRAKFDLGLETVDRQAEASEAPPECCRGIEEAQVQAPGRAHADNRACLRRSVRR